VNWHEVASSGVGFAFMKATEGTGYTDATFRANWANSRAAGIAVRGAYHFGHPGTNAVAQADHFVDTVGSVGAGDLMALDIETSDGVGPSGVAAWCKQFVDRVMERTGLPASRVVVYTGAWFWNPQAGGSDVLANHPLWVSGYVQSPPMPRGWSTYTFWQFTDKHNFPGISPCDASYFRGQEQQLRAMAGL